MGRVGISPSRETRVKVSKRYNYGIAYNDISPVNRHDKAYVTWKSMLQRCYCKSFLERHPTYIGCSVCEEWLVFSRFKKWYDKNHLLKESELDKDILVKGNKIYSPSTCCFVPHRINAIIEKNDAQRGKYPIGVYFDNQRKCFGASLHERGKDIYLGHFDTPEDAFMAYKSAKEAYLTYMATVYYMRGFITRKVYLALKKYKVEMTD